MSEKGTAAAKPFTLSFDTPAPQRDDALIGHTAAFCRVREQLDCLATHDEPLVLTGEAGTGKSGFARAAHAASPRATAMMAVVSCRTLPEALLEAELFGCVKGSIVGAAADRHGLLDVAHGGTVVLEDVDELTLHSQALLLRFLETGEVRPLGTRGAGTPSDVRIVATTRRPLKAKVAQGAFNGDLYAALGVHDIELPALRDRRPDVPVLADYFARATADPLGRSPVHFSAEAHRALMAYSWPGNVTELRRVVERLVRQAAVGEIGAHALPVGIRPRASAGDGARRRRERSQAVAETLFQRLVAGHESFWSSVYPLFMAREITRADLRDLLRRGLRASTGDLGGLMHLFNMPPADERRFVTFLRRYDCYWTP